MMSQAIGRGLEELPDLLVAIKDLSVDCTGIQVGVFCKQGQGRIPVLAIAGIAVMLAVSLSRRLGISGQQGSAMAAFLVWAFTSDYAHTDQANGANQ